MTPNCSNFAIGLLRRRGLIPQFIWLDLIYIVGRTLFKSNQVALISVVILIGHFILDFFSGHMHHIFGQNSMEADLGYYASAPYLAVFIEAIFTAITLWYFLR
jgi:hypothetical protein